MVIEVNILHLIEISFNSDSFHRFFLWKNKRTKRKSRSLNYFLHLLATFVQLHIRIYIQSEVLLFAVFFTRMIEMDFMQPHFFTSFFLFLVFFRFSQDT